MMYTRSLIVRLIPESGLLFVFIGAIGFVVDGGILTLLTSSSPMNVYAARAISFPLATVVTWYLNRSFTFRTDADTASKKEYLRYLLVQTGGSMLNITIFVVLTQIFAWMNNIPIVPLAFGAVFGMMFNYTFSKIWVFKAGIYK